MEIRTISDQKKWNNWAHENNAPFSQSWEWGEILLSEGKLVERLAVVEGEEILAQAQVVVNPLVFGWKYGFCGMGPVWGKNNESRILNQGYGELVNFFKKSDCIFLRIEPPSVIHDSKFKILKSKDINPRATNILDLNKTEDELLVGMHEKTRYNIRLAGKKGLTISTEKNYEEFMRLMRETGGRDDFRLHLEGHYKAMFASDFTKQVSAIHEGRIIATALVISFGETFTYVYGASDYKQRALMAPQFLQWEMIKMAKIEGCKKYDFFGIAPSCHSDPALAGVESLDTGERDSFDANLRTGSSVATLTQDDRCEYMYDPKHQYAGVTRFKLGFGGEVVEKPGTFDLVIARGRYFIYGLMRRARRLF